MALKVIETRARHRRWLAAALGALALAGCWSALQRPEVIAPRPAEPLLVAPGGERAESSRIEAVPRAEAAPLATAVPRGAAASCTGQQVQVAGAGNVAVQCLGDLRTLQNGSMLSFEAHAQGAGSDRWLRIDTAGLVVVAAALGTGAVTEFSCQADACTGIGVGPADLQGVRRISLKSAPLHAPDGAAEARLDGLLATPAEDPAERAAACDGQGVLVDASGGRATRFCPDDGISVDGGAVGGPSYRYGSLDGASIELGLDENGALRHLAYGSLACEGEGCAGVAIVPGAPGAPGSVMLSGTLLQSSAQAGEWASLTGRLVLP